MSRILLADDSPHAQRMGERILSEEGFEVVSITDGETVLIRLADVDPDVMVVDAFLPGKSGFDLCSYIKSHPRHLHTRVVLTAGALEPLDEVEAQRAGADGILKKPFEASVVLETVKPLAAAAEAAREQRVSVPEETAPVPEETPADPPPLAPGIDPELVRAAVTLALDQALPVVIDEIAQRVLIALNR
jgi:DNA-binding response OmpR family regulator